MLELLSLRRVHRSATIAARRSACKAVRATPSPGNSAAMLPYTRLTVVAIFLFAAVACEESEPAAYPPSPEPGEEVDVAAQSDAYADTDPSALQDFHPALDPYGTWVDDPTYGTVWVPNRDVVGDDFEAYVTAGHWVYDDDD